MKILKKKVFLNYFSRGIGVLHWPFKLISVNFTLQLCENIFQNNVLLFSKFLALVQKIQIFQKWLTKVKIGKWVLLLKSLKTNLVLIFIHFITIYLKSWHFYLITLHSMEGIMGGRGVGLWWEVLANIPGLYQVPKLRN